MAALHADLEEFEQSIDLLQQAVMLEPNFVGGYQMLGKILSRFEGRKTEAQAAFRQAQEIQERYRTTPKESQYAHLLLKPIL